MYAIVKTGGKQYRVQPGEVVQVESLAWGVFVIIELKQVCLVHGDKGLQIGRPWVDKATVTAEIVNQDRTRSITIFKKHRRKNYRRTKGHRQGFTKLRITGITA